jgi:hypothetical protein
MPRLCQGGDTQSGHSIVTVTLERQRRECRAKLGRICVQECRNSDRATGMTSLVFRTGARDNTVTAAGTLKGDCPV